MFPFQRTVRILLAAALGVAVGLLWPGPGFIVPTLAVVTFILSCFALRCLSIWVTFAFVIFVGMTPILAFAYGYWTHTPLLESVLISAEGFARHFNLGVALFLGPLAAGVLLHVILRHIGVRHVRT